MGAAVFVDRWSRLYTSPAQEDHDKEDGGTGDHDEQAAEGGLWPQTF